MDAAGEPVLLFDQNRAEWDQLLIRRGLAALAQAESLGGTPGPYFLQAEIAACHAGARTAEETDWPRIVSLYESLSRIMPSPVIDLNRAMAISMADGPAAGLKVVDALTAERAASLTARRASGNCFWRGHALVQRADRTADETRLRWRSNLTEVPR